MMIHEITEKVGKYKSRKRIGRGEASGTGGTAGRGHKGAKSRAGFSRRPYFEGGQMSFIRRLPKRGFSNAAFRTEFQIVNLKLLESRMDEGAEVNAAVLAKAGIIRKADQPLKILGEGELTKKLKVSAHKFSKSAQEKIEKAGGTVTVIEMPTWHRDTHGGGPGKRDKGAAAKAAAASQAPATATKTPTESAES